jgi:exodeoxyribonuclease VII large subunit
MFAAAGAYEQDIHRGDIPCLCGAFSHLLKRVKRKTIEMSTDWDHDPATGEILSAKVPNVAEYSVSELSHKLKRTVEDAFGHVRVRGEISGFRGPHSSGHVYFSIKDEGAKLEAVIWKGTFARLRTRMQEGLEVVATGKITTYPGKSNYQIVIDNIEPAGVGALMALLEERKRKLAAEGLFDAARKRPLPFIPVKIGVVTSPTGAVIRDILHRLADRFPRPVLVWPVRVQGETSAAEVATAIKGFNAMANPPDLLIVARGGGSLEDLWGFNEEIVVRAVAASQIPVISAVGHETDTTLIDLVADHRAPTPTAAAERAVPVRAELVAVLATLKARQARGLSRYFSEVRTRLQGAGRALPKPEEMLALVRQRLDAASARLPQGLRANLQHHRIELARQASRLSLGGVRRLASDYHRRLAETGLRARAAIDRKVSTLQDKLQAEAKLFAALNYTSVLERGFAVIMDKQGKPLKRAAEVAGRQSLKIRFADDTVEVTARPKTGQGELF